MLRLACRQRQGSGGCLGMGGLSACGIPPHQIPHPRTPQAYKAVCALILHEMKQLKPGWVGCWPRASVARWARRAAGLRAPGHVLADGTMAWDPAVMSH